MNPHQVLGVAADATAEEIKKAYKKKAVQFHPDRNPDDKDAEAKFKEATEAYEILTGKSKKQPHVDPSGFDPFADFFGDMHEAERGPVRFNIETQATIRLVDAIVGAHVNTQVPIITICNTCHGDKMVPGEACGVCKGSGRQSSRRGPMMITHTCMSCGGTGKAWSPCSSCSGAGRSIAEKSINIKIPAGVLDGAAMRIRGLGAGESDEHRGDIIIRIRVESDPKFRISGKDVLTEETIDFSTMILGGDVTIRTLAGDVTLKIPSYSQQGNEIRVNGQGVRLSEPGDLVVKLRVGLPTSLPDEVLTSLKTLKRESDVAVINE